MSMGPLCPAIRLSALVLLSPLCTETVASYRDSRTYCSTKSVIERQAASVTCHFPEDLTVHRHSVNVVRYDFDRGSFLPELVLRCFWEPGKRTPNCAVAEGFDFDGQINQTVTVSIREAGRKHAGTYTCNYSAADPSEFNVCRLHVKRPKISCMASAVNIGDPATVSCSFNTNLNHTKEGFYIRRVPSNMDAGTEWDMLTCIWNEGSTHGIFCQTKEGCRLATTAIGTQVTVSIAKVDRDHTGQYFCDTVPHTRGVKVDPCYLTAGEKVPSDKIHMEDETPPDAASSAHGFCPLGTLMHHGVTATLALFAWKEALK